MTEATLKRRALAYLKLLKAAGWPLWFVKRWGTAMQPGLPDLQIIYRGHAVEVELKRPGKKATKLQQHTLNEQAAAGATTATVDNMEEFIELMNRLQKERGREGSRR